MLPLQKLKKKTNTTSSTTIQWWVVPGFVRVRWVQNVMDARPQLQEMLAGKGPGASCWICRCRFNLMLRPCGPSCTRSRSHAKTKKNQFVDIHLSHLRRFSTTFVSGLGVSISRSFRNLPQGMRGNFAHYVALVIRVGWPLDPP